MSIEEKRREGFEAWAVSTDRAYRTILSGHVVFRDDGEYGLWAAWNAALDSVVIELEEAGDPEDFFYDFQVITRSGAVNAIESAGLKVKS